jgi:hypothetical protein
MACFLDEAACANSAEQTVAAFEINATSVISLLVLLAARLERQAAWRHRRDLRRPRASVDGPATTRMALPRPL